MTEWITIAEAFAVLNSLCMAVKKKTHLFSVYIREKQMKNMIIEKTRIIHIGKKFETIDGIVLSNRFMCVVKEDKQFLYMLPMSSFRGKARSQKLLLKQNFEYSVVDGNRTDAYIKCDEVYKLRIEDFKDLIQYEGIQRKWRINDQTFEKLMKNFNDCIKRNMVREKIMVFIN